ncbi:MAG: hypothetical protein VX874_17600 [Pseudomonadota bacterium]|nr:hypothetical protein [Pseudomonadota bacterium]
MWKTLAKLVANQKQPDTLIRLATLPESASDGVRWHCIRQPHYQRGSIMPWRPSADVEFQRDFRRKQKDQSPRMSRAEFDPIPDDVLTDSDALYLSKDNLSFFATVWQDKTLPIRALYHAGLSVAERSTSPLGGHANPSVTLDECCKFRLEVMDAALDDTPVDLLVFLAISFYLPNPREWSQEPEWAGIVLTFVTNQSLDPLSRYANALLLARIGTSGADFRAFREAATTLQDIGMFDTSPPSATVDAFVQDLFPSIRARSAKLLARRQQLEWHSDRKPESSFVTEELISSLLQS